jgi:hypothetical protein
MNLSDFENIARFFDYPRFIGICSCREGEQRARGGGLGRDAAKEFLAQDQSCEKGYNTGSLASSGVFAPLCAGIDRSEVQTEEGGAWTTRRDSG